MIELDDNDLKNVIDFLGHLPEQLRISLEEANKKRFNTLTDVNGAPYKPNAPSWIIVKGNNTPTIGITGNMKADLTVTNEGDVIRMISNMDYASFVQKEREFLGISETELQSILDAQEDKLRV